MTKLKPWYQVVTPREDLRENRPMDASEFAVHLDHIRDKRENVSADYLEPGRFFDRTYLTDSLLELALAGRAAAVGHSGGNLGRVQHGHAVRRRQNALADHALSPRRARR